MRWKVAPAPAPPPVSNKSRAQAKKKIIGKKLQNGRKIDDLSRSGGRPCTIVCLPCSPTCRRTGSVPSAPLPPSQPASAPPPSPPSPTLLPQSPIPLPRPRPPRGPDARGAALDLTPRGRMDKGKSVVAELAASFSDVLVTPREPPEPQAKSFLPSPSFCKLPTACLLMLGNWLGLLCIGYGCLKFP